MGNRSARAGVWVLALASLLATPSAAPSPSPARAGRGGLADVPPLFEENEGQFDPRVRYLARSHGMLLRLTDDGAVLTPARARAARGGSGAITMRVVGAKEGSALVASEPAATRTSYYVGRDRAKWRSDVRSYGRVTARSVLPGIDETFYGTPEGIEYDLVVAPGARPESVEIAFDGVEHIGLVGEGDLELRTPAGVLVQRRPRVYQRGEGGLHDVAARYRIAGETTVALSFADYDHGKELVIDPTFAYSTYYGGSDIDEGFGVATDAQGASYVVGSTASSNLPTMNPEQAANAGPDDVFIAKLAPDGKSLVFATYLGGSDEDDPFAISVDPSGNVYVTGTTESMDYPTTANAPYASLNGNSDAFVTELSADGTQIVYSTYLGGGNQDTGYGIATDTSGAAYVVGMTQSTDWPTLNAEQAAPGGGLYDGFVVKVAPGGGSLAYSTYLGGLGVDFVYGVALDAAGDVFVTGQTTSTNFPTQSPLQASNAGSTDAFVAELASGGQTLVFSTYLGGTASEIGQSVAVDATGAVYVTGMTASTNFPTKNAEQIASGGGTSDAFVAKIAAGGASLVYSTYLGGSAADWGWAIGVDATGTAYVAGATSSTNFPTVAPLQAINAGDGDAFVAKLEPAGGTLAFSTYLGGAYNDVARGIAVGAQGTVYVTGYTSSTNFPAVNAEQSACGGTEDSFVTSISTVDENADAGPGTDAGDAGSTDGGSDAAVDSGPEPPDAGPGDSGPTTDSGAPVDAGSPRADASTPPHDAGSAEPDASADAAAPSPATDAGNAARDSGTEASDAGSTASQPPASHGFQCTASTAGAAATPSLAGWLGALGLALAALARRRTPSLAARR